MLTIDYEAIRSLFSGKLTDAQRDGVSVIVATFNTIGDGDRMKLAYVLATAYHETGRKMQPVVESLNYTSAARIKEVWPSRFKTAKAAEPFVRNPEKLAERVYGMRKDLGNDQPGDGWKYRGRGLAQLTGKARYKHFGHDKNPDALLDPVISANVLVRGLLAGEFTGKRLGDFIKPGDVDFKGARACVNADVTANGSKIAGYASKFALAIKTEAVRRVEAPAPSPAPEPQAPEQAPATGSKAAKGAGVVAGAGGAAWGLISNGAAMWTLLVLAIVIVAVCAFIFPDFRKMLEGWKTRILAFITMILGMADFLDPSLISQALGLDQKGRAITVIAIGLAVWLMRELTKKPGAFVKK